MRQLTLFDPVEIPLTKGYVALVDSIDADLAGLRWCTHLCRQRPYAKRGTEIRDGHHRTELMHRVVLSRIINRPLLSSECADHIDGNPLNNCRSNLRLATPAENARNRGKQRDNTSGFKGVHWNKQRRNWRAQIKINQKGIHLGVFDTPEEAYAAYCKAAKELHGEFAGVE